MISLRQNGASLSEIQGRFLGPGVQRAMRFYTLLMMVLVGVVFVAGPAKLLASLTPASLDATFWVVVIFLYYFLANLHPQSLPIFPMLFITIACRAISGFHATQSPLMARCMANERLGRPIFYGAMIAEGVIALVWAAAGMAFYRGIPGLDQALAAGGPGGAVHTITTTLLGTTGGVLAMLGVIACPITSADTAFRSARLILADALGMQQGQVSRRILLALPLFAAGVVLTFVNFEVIWRYFAWANKTLAAVTLWAMAVFLARVGKKHWVATLPALLMSAVCLAYILQAPGGLGLGPRLANGLAVAVSALMLAGFLSRNRDGTGAAADCA